MGYELKPDTDYRRLILDKASEYGEILKLDIEVQALDMLISRINKEDNAQSNGSDLVLPHSGDVGIAVETSLLESHKWRDVLAQRHPDYNPDTYTAETIIAAYLHDLGKSNIEANIRYSPGRLDMGGMSEVRKHSEYTGHLLYHLGFGGIIPEIAANHHESLDGKGYYMKTADQIPFGSKIIKIYDILVASLSRDWPGLPSRTTEQTFRFMTSDKHIKPQIDQELIGALSEQFFRVGRAQEALVKQKRKD